MENLLSRVKDLLLNAVEWFVSLPKRIRVISVAAVAGLLVVILVSLLSAGITNQKFVGTWDEIDSDGNLEGETIVFANDGTGSVKSSGISGSLSWNVRGNKVFITVSLCGITETEEMSYKFSGDTLTLVDEDGEESIYRKRYS